MVYMKYFLLISFLFCGLISSNAQEKTIIITESSLPYTEQQWIWGGNFPSDNIKTCWDKGKRIHAAAYTAKGWFLSMAKGTGYTMQTYYNNSASPWEWVADNWNKNYRITDLAYGDGKWLVVMSTNSGIGMQCYKCDKSWNALYSWITERRKEGYMITSLTHTGSEWVAVVSKGSQYASQGCFFASTPSDLVSKVKSDVWGKGYKVHKIEYGDNSYLVIYGKYATNTGRKQNFWAECPDPQKYISERWNASQNIAYIGGGKARTGNSNNYVASNNQNNNNNSKDFRTNLDNGGYIDYHFGDDGKLYTTHVMQCIFCHGSKKCGICSGSGRNYYGYPCSSCFGSGTCSYCKGQGYTVTKSVTDANGNDYMVSSNGYVSCGSGGSYVITGPDGKTTVRSSGSSSSGSDKRSSSSPSQRICPKCNGRGYDPKAYDYAPPIIPATGWKNPLYTSGSCKYCNRIDAHYHLPCTECRGYGHIRN